MRTLVVVVVLLGVVAVPPVVGVRRLGPGQGPTAGLLRVGAWWRVAAACPHYRVVLLPHAESRHGSRG